MSFDPASLMASLVVSGIGWVLFSYGRKERRVPHVGIGLLMLGYPYAVTSVPLMLGLVPVLLGVLWVMTKLGL